MSPVKLLACAAAVGMSVSVAGLSGCKSTEPSWAASIAFETAPSAAEAQVVMTPPFRVQFLDASGGRMDVDFPVEVSLAASVDGATLLGTTTVRSVGGVATFADLRVDRPSTGLTFVMESNSGTIRSNITPVHATFAQISAGFFHSCGVTVAGYAFCWGTSQYGQLGVGPAGQSPLTAPTPLASGLRFLSISAAITRTCAVAAAGTTWCWGFDHVGDGTNAPRVTPQQVMSGLSARHVSTLLNTCALTTAGVAYCWGPNEAGEIGDGTKTERLTPTLVAGGLQFAQISTGVVSCGVTAAGVTYCWGPNGSGQVGDGTTTDRLMPTAVAGGHLFREVSVGGASACGVASDGAIYCWGAATDGRHLEPTPVAGGLSFLAVSTGSFHVCGITTDRAAYCWGDNANGELGDGTTNSSTVPVAVQGGLPFAQISAGVYHTCGVTTDRVAYCWGYNLDGQLGSGNSGDVSLTPRRLIE